MRALRELCVFHLRIRYWLRLRALLQMCDSGRRKRRFSTGGLRPPLLSLVQRASAGRKTIFAVHKRTFTRAAGVSPPWFGRYVYADTSAIARKTADSMWADHRCHRVQRYHGGLTPPAPGCTTFVRCKKRYSRCTNARSQERRASARRGFPNRVCRCNAMNFRVWISRAECTPRGAYASRSRSGMRALGELCVLQQQIRPEHRCVPERAQHTCVFICRLDTFTTGGLRPPLLAPVQRACAGRTTIFAVHKRTFARAAGVSPPWSYEPHLQVQCDQFPRFELACAVHSTGGLRPPLLVGNASAARIMHIPAANSSGTSLRPGTRPAHMRIPSADSIRSPQLGHAIRSWLRLRTLLQMCDSGRRKRCFSTGGLRPPLLVAQCRFAGENHSRGAQRTSLRKTTFAVHKRTFTRAAGVSPPWCGKIVPAETVPAV
jgi:hypothetical protein